MDNQLLCPQCQQNFDLYTRIPRIIDESIKCGHSLCESCIKVNLKGEQSFKCPQDNIYTFKRNLDQFHLDEKTIDFLQNSFQQSQQYTALSENSIPQNQIQTEQSLLNNKLNSARNNLDIQTEQQEESLLNNKLYEVINNLDIQTEQQYTQESNQSFHNIQSQQKANLDSNFEIEQLYLKKKEIESNSFGKQFQISNQQLAMQQQQKLLEQQRIFEEQQQILSQLQNMTPKQTISFREVQNYDYLTDQIEQTNQLQFQQEEQQQILNQYTNQQIKFFQKEKNEIPFQTFNQFQRESFMPSSDQVSPYFRQVQDQLQYQNQQIIQQSNINQDLKQSLKLNQQLPNQFQIQQVVYQQQSTNEPSQTLPTTVQQIQKFSLSPAKVENQLINNNIEQNQKQNENKIQLDQINFCIEHEDQKTDQICIECRLLVCAFCGLYGKHTNHRMQPEKKFLSEIQFSINALKQTLQTIDEKQGSQQQKFEQMFDTFIKKKIKQKEENILNEIQFYFQNIEGIIQNKKKQLIQKLNDNLFGLLQTFQSFNEIPNEKINQKLIKWKQELQKEINLWDKIDKVQTQNGSIDLEFLRKKDFLQQVGEDILIEYQYILDLPKEIIDEFLGHIQFNKQQISDNFFENIVSLESNLDTTQQSQIINKKLQSFSLLTQKMLVSSKEYQIDQQRTMLESQIAQQQLTFDKSSDIFGIIEQNIQSIRQTLTPSQKQQNSIFNLQQKIIVQPQFQLQQIQQNLDENKQNVLQQQQQSNQQQIQLEYWQLQQQQQHQIQNQANNIQSQKQINYNQTMSIIPQKNQQSKMSNTNSQNKKTSNDQKQNPKQSILQVPKEQNNFMIEKQSILQKSPGESSRQTIMQKSPNRQTISQHLPVKKAQQTKKKSPELENVLNQLKNGVHIENIELSNQQVNDYELGIIANHLVTYENNVEIIKLIKNQITDEGFEKLMKALSENNKVHTINLTNNELSIKCFDYIIQYLQNNSTLKNIQLVKNNIKLTKQNPIQNDIKALNININL